MNSSEELYILNDDQKALVRDNGASMEFNALTKLVSNNPNADGRDKIGRSIKEFMVKEMDLKPVATKRTIKGEFVLTEYHRQTIESNIKSMKPLEMVKVLFPDMLNPTLLSSEGRAIYKYYKEIANDKVYDMWDEPVESQEYKPPINFQALVGRANAYIPNQTNPAKSAYDTNNLRPVEERHLRALFAYVKTARFRYQASIYDKKADRVLFESTFIRYTADKAAELTPEEVDQYIAAAGETLNTVKIQRRIDAMENLIDTLLDGIDDNGDRKRLSMTHVETVNVLRTKLTDSKKLTQSLIQSLAGSRAEKMENRIKQSSSIINLVDAWVQEESRIKLIKLGQREKEEDANEVNRLSSMEHVKVLIQGLTQLEASK